MRTRAWKTQVQKHLNCIPPDYKMGEAFITKTCNSIKVIGPELGLRLARS